MTARCALYMSFGWVVIPNLREEEVVGGCGWYHSKERWWLPIGPFIFTARCTTVQSAVLLSYVVCLSVCLSVTLMDHDHIGWKSWKLIARTISPTSSLFVAQRLSTYSHENMEKFWGENVRSAPTSITSDWIESIESHVILGRCGCLFTLVGASRGHLCDSTDFL